MKTVKDFVDELQKVAKIVFSKMDLGINPDNIFLSHDEDNTVEFGSSFSVTVSTKERSNGVLHRPYNVPVYSLCAYQYFPARGYDPPDYDVMEVGEYESGAQLLGALVSIIMKDKLENILEYIGDEEIENSNY